MVDWRLSCPQLSYWCIEGCCQNNRSERGDDVEDLGTDEEVGKTRLSKRLLRESFGPFGMHAPCDCLWMWGEAENSWWQEQLFLSLCWFKHPAPLAKLQRPELEEIQAQPQSALAYCRCFGCRQDSANRSACSHDVMCASKHREEIYGACTGRGWLLGLLESVAHQSIWDWICSFSIFLSTSSHQVTNERRYFQWCFHCREQIWCNSSGAGTGEGIFVLSSVCGSSEGVLQHPHILCPRALWYLLLGHSSILELEAQTSVWASNSGESIAVPRTWRCSYHLRDFPKDFGIGK